MHAFLLVMHDYQCLVTIGSQTGTDFPKYQIAKLHLHIMYKYGGDPTTFI